MLFGLIASNSSMRNNPLAKLLSLKSLILREELDLFGEEGDASVIFLLAHSRISSLAMALLLFVDE